MKEIERKFLVSELPNITLENFETEIIKQGYLAIADDFSREVRVRSINDSYVLTLKKGKSLERSEFETDITRDEFEEWWPDTENRRVEKIRYILPLGANTIELDIYSGKLAGLIIAEVEFKSREEALAFEPPHWFTEDVTERSEYKNASLALYGLERLKEWSVA